MQARIEPNLKKQQKEPIETYMNEKDEDEAKHNDPSQGGVRAEPFEELNKDEVAEPSKNNPRQRKSSKAVKFQRVDLTPILSLLITLQFLSHKL